MTDTLRQFFRIGVAGTTAGSTVEVSGNGVVRVDPEKLVISDEVQAQIATLNKLIKDGMVELTHKS